MSHPLADQSEQLAARLGLTPAAVESRLKALDLTSEARNRLRAVLPKVEPLLDGFLESLYARFQQTPELSALVRDPELVARLKKMQRKYMVDLLEAEQDWAYALSRIQIGVVHHRVRLTPQWLLLTYAHLLTFQTGILFREAGSPAAGLSLLVTLLKSALFDATLILDAYGLVEEMSVAQRKAGQLKPAAGGSAASALASGGAVERHPVTRLRLTTETVVERREYVDLTPSDLEILAGLNPVFEAALPTILDSFYRFFAARPETAALVPVEAVPRLQQQVRSFWQEFLTGSFDRPHAASRMRIGVVHERINLTPQWYLVGLAVQAEGLLAAIVQSRPDPIGALDAFLKALFFDAGYVIEAYMEARAQTVLRTEGYASQLVAGLASGVVVVDGDHRVLSVNRTLLDYLQVDSMLLYRVPIEQALPVAELKAVLDQVGEGAGKRQRASIAGQSGGRTYRLTAILLDPWEGIRGRPVAIVIDDLSDLVRLARDSEQDAARLAAVIAAMDVVLWELDPSTWTIDLISASVLGMTGFSDVYFLGRPEAWTNCIAEEDRENFKNECLALRSGSRAAVVEHRFQHADGPLIWVRASLRRVPTADGSQRVAGVMVDITEVRRLEQLRQERDRAEAQSRAKSEFLAIMSHEIRTPLNGVIGMHEYLLSGDLPREIEAQVRTANQSALELLGFLEDVLNTSTLESGSIRLHETRFGLAELVERLIDLYRPLATERGLTLAFAPDENLASYWLGDAGRLRQVLANLISNAIKFTDRGGVTLAVSSPATGLRFVVEDSGAVVPEAGRPQLFEAFSQTHTAMGGSGLGLFISKRLAQLMGGDIRYEAGKEGGSRFTVEIPLAPTAEPILPAGEERRLMMLLSDDLARRCFPVNRLKEAGWRVETKLSRETAICFVDEPGHVSSLPGHLPVVLCGRIRPETAGIVRPGATYGLGLAPLNGDALARILTSVSGQAAVGSRGTALVAEDDRASQVVVKLMLERLGFEVDIVANGALAVDAARRRAYSLVLLDMHMPEMGGLAAARLVRSGSLNVHTAILAMTANHYLDDREACLAAGMNDLVTKPLQWSGFAELVRRCVGASS